MSDISKKISFILELEKLKNVLRKTKPVGLSRFENSAEHSWQTTMSALIFLEGTSLNQLHVLKMLLIHDVVEIDAGDVFVYDTAKRKEIAAEELAAAQRIFGMLPAPIGPELLGLWEEFERNETPEARFAKAMDRVNPVLQNLAADGQSWVENKISRDRVVAMNSQISNASPELWAVLYQQLQDATFFDE